MPQRHCRELAGGPSSALWPHAPAVAAAAAEWDRLKAPLLAFVRTKRHALYICCDWRAAQLQLPAVCSHSSRLLRWAGSAAAVAHIEMCRKQPGDSAAPLSQAALVDAATAAAAAAHASRATLCLPVHLPPAYRARAMAAPSSDWIFGFGSLIHNPGFEYSETLQPCYIRGYRCAAAGSGSSARCKCCVELCRGRRIAVLLTANQVLSHPSCRRCRRVFHQGSTDHRGVPSAPGRTVTLEPAENAVTVGDFLLAEEQKGGKSTSAAGRNMDTVQGLHRYRPQAAVLLTFFLQYESCLAGFC